LERRGDVQNISPEESASYAKTAGCIGISWTFNEPTLWFEYTLDSAKYARSQGLFTNYVTNGYITEEALDTIAPFLDVYRVDIKGFSEKTYQRICHMKDYRRILETTKRANEYGMHVEVVTNVIPGFNDSGKELRGIASWIKNTLGPETPWHVTRFYPQLELSHLPPTPIAVLERAWSIGKEEGLWYVYVGNVPGHQWENTYCHICGELLIERYVFDIVTNKINGGKCSHCGSTIPGKFPDV
jgi:pyruvate formate lyase activating enzyme